MWMVLEAHRQLSFLSCLQCWITAIIRLIGYLLKTQPRCNFRPVNVDALNYWPFSFSWVVGITHFNCLLLFPPSSPIKSKVAGFLSCLPGAGFMTGMELIGRIQLFFLLGSHLLEMGAAKHLWYKTGKDRLETKIYYILVHRADNSKTRT